MTKGAWGLIQTKDSPAELLGDWGWQVWLRWLGCTTVGYLLKGMIMTAAPMRTPRDLALAPAAGALGLGAVGFLQWLILRRYLKRVKWWTWVLATVLGQIAAMMIVAVAVAGPLLLGALTPVVEHIGSSALQFVTRLITGALLGAVLGFAQWLVLRRHLPAAVWWIPTTALAGAAVALLPVAPSLGLGFGRVGTILTTQLVTGVIVGSMTGLILIWLLRKTQQVPVIRRPPAQ